MVLEGRRSRHVGRGPGIVRRRPQHDGGKARRRPAEPEPREQHVHVRGGERRRRRVEPAHDGANKHVP